MEMEGKGAGEEAREEPVQDMERERGPRPRSGTSRAPPRRAGRSPPRDHRVMAIAAIAIVALAASAFAFRDDGPYDDAFEWEDEDEDEGRKIGYTSEFGIAARTWASNGSNGFFILEPGYRLVLEGDDDGVELKVQITVLDDTRTVDGVLCRVVEEREWEDGELIEVSRNWFAMDVGTDSVFYFGEEVDDYEDGAIVGHEGGWESGVDGAKAGLMMPGLVLLGSSYYLEVAPGVAMDRAMHVATDVAMDVPAGTFTDCLRVMEDNPVEGSEKEYKTYAPGVGLVQDEEAVLTSYGFI